MQPEIVAAFVAGAFSLIAVVLSARIGVNLRSLREELQLGLAEERVKAYRVLWELLEPVSPTRKAPLDQQERITLGASLGRWYYKDGNGLFLSNESRERYMAGRDALENNQDVIATREFSELRSDLKKDLGIYNRRERLRKPTTDPLRREVVS